MSRSFAVFLVAGAGVILVGAFFIYVLLASRSADYWRGEVAAFERADISNPPPKGVMVFIGADYIRLWPSLEADMAPYAIIRRGLGGAQVSHLTYYADKLVTVHEPRAIVLSAGIADLSDVGGATAEEVFSDFLAFFNKVQRVDTKPKIYVLAIPQPPLKKRYWPLIRALNNMLAAHAAKTPDIHFVDVATPLLTHSGLPRSHFFRWEGYHLTDEAYRIWSRVLRRALAEKNISASVAFPAPAAADAPISP